MNILILALDIGRNAPGIVFERLIYGLADHHTVDVVCGTVDSTLDWKDKPVTFTRVNYRRVDWRLNMFFISVLGCNPYDNAWIRKVKKQALSSAAHDYDVVISFLYAAGTAVLIAGNDISKSLGRPHMAHLLDAVPAPVGWLKDGPYYKGLKRIISRYLPAVDALSSTNTEMLRYQVQASGISSKTITEVLYNPYQGQPITLPLPEDETNVFVFTGGLYGPRTPRFVIDAFALLLDEYPGSRLVFVGKELPKGVLDGIEEKKKAAIEVHLYTKDLVPYYTMATALLDIDAVIDNDVFISSKIVNYININRIIISETGISSPARSVFGGLPSVLICRHDAAEICNAMKKAISLKGSVSFSDRDNVRDLFKLDNVIEKMNTILERIAGKN